MRIVKYHGYALLLVVCISSLAVGDLLSTDPAAIPGWQGTRHYSVVGVGSLKVDVDYAVYAPGQLATSTVLDAPTYPGADTQYVYAYQIHNNIGGSQYLETLSVGFQDQVDFDSLTEPPELPSNIGFLAGLGNVPTNTSFSTGLTSARWSFVPTNVEIGQHSTVLIYTSPYPPEWDKASIQGGFAMIATENLPSPVPEPASVFLLTAAVLVAVLAAAARRGRFSRFTAKYRIVMVSTPIII
jgi:hypothetical protein